jgi:hypothetical protein
MKSNQKSSQQRGFFAAQALPGKSNRITGCNLLPVLALLLKSKDAKVANASPTAQPNLFCLISSEAFSADDFH